MQTINRPTYTIWDPNNFRGRVRVVERRSHHKFSRFFVEIYNLHLKKKNNITACNQLRGRYRSSVKKHTLLLYSSTKLPSAKRNRLSGRTLQFMPQIVHGASYLQISFLFPDTPVALAIMAMLKAKIQAELQQSARNKQRHQLKLIKYKWRHSRPRFCARPSPAGTNSVKSSRRRTWGRGAPFKPHQFSHGMRREGRSVESAYIVDRCISRFM